MQLDRVLSALNSNARANLQTLLQGLGQTLDGVADRGAERRGGPRHRGLTAGQSLNKSLDYSADAFKASAIVNPPCWASTRTISSGVVTGNERIFQAWPPSRIISRAW